MFVLVVGCAVLFVVFCAGAVYGQVLSYQREQAALYEAHCIADAPSKLEIWVNEGNRRGARWFSSLPAYRITSVLSLCAAGRAFTVRDLSGVLSRSEFEALRGELIGRGFMAWVSEENHRLGVRWSASGRALLRYLQRDGAIIEQDAVRVFT